MKQFKNKASINNRPKQTPAANTKSNITKQIDKLSKRIEDANDSIKQTQKLLDVDLFLKQQKQKRAEHAKNITAEYEAQKKIREEKLYKKHNRDKQEPNIEFKTNNFVGFSPIGIMKAYVNSLQELGWVKEGHFWKISDVKVEGLRESEEKLFSQWHKISGEKTKYDGDSQNKHIVWKNIKEVVENSLEIATLPVAIQDQSLIICDQTSQNLFNALALLTPNLSTRFFQENDEIFQAKMFSPSKQVTVITDKYILVRQFTHKYVNLGSKSINPNVMWPTLIQKCYNKLRKSFKADELQDSVPSAIFSVYGVDPQIVAISNKNVIKQNFYLVLGHLLQEGRVGFMSVGGHNKQVFENRIYPLLEIRQNLKKNSEQKQIRFSVKNPWRGQLIDSENINKFTLLELLELFNCVVLIRDYPSKWACLRINFSYFSNGPVGVTSNQWTKNPQYLFTITKDMQVRIVLRKVGRSLQEIKSQKQGIFGFLLFQNKEANNKIQCMKMDALIIKTKSTDLNESSYCGTLKKGNYIILPYSTEPSEKSYQFYTFDFYIQKQQAIQFGKARIFDWNYVGKNQSRLNTDEKIIQSLESVEKFERPRVEKMTLAKLFASKIKKSVLQELNLNIYKNADIGNFYTPGFICNLLIDKAIEIEANAKNKSKNNNKINQNSELNQEEQAENLSILLGYDALNDDINQGKMKDYLEQNVNAYDFSNFGLGQEGLTPILECITQNPQIISLNLSGNDLNDNAITYVCYYLEKTNRTEIRELNVANNRFGSIGRSALQGLKSIFPKVVIT